MPRTVQDFKELTELMTKTLNRHFDGVGITFVLVLTDGVFVNAGGTSTDDTETLDLLVQACDQVLEQGRVSSARKGSC